MHTPLYMTEPGDYAPIGGIDFVTVLNDDKKVAEVYERDDARRIVACWNALSAFTTEEIERGRVDLVRLVQQRDELLAALKQAQDVLATLIDPDSQHVSSLHVFAQAKAAEASARAIIAKCEAK